jgi:hypothetical protein
MRCSLCKKNGHTKRSCKNAEVLEPVSMDRVLSVKSAPKIEMEITPEIQTENKKIISLYGFSQSNCCKKDQTSEKVSNALLPISFGIYSQKKNYAIALCDSKLEVSNLEKCFYEDSKFETEKSYIHPNFRHAPPNDVYVTHNGSSVFYESKVVMSKANKTELILRQDCYAFNVLQHIIVNNTSKKFKDVDSLLKDTLVETPYLWMLLWKKVDERIVFDCIVFTDVSIIRMIKNANTERTKEALKLINRSLSEYESNGVMTYKNEKSSTVAHQKVSLFPIRDIPSLREYPFTFLVKSTDIVICDVRSDTSLWQEIEKNRLHDKIKSLTEKLHRLMKKCGEMQ